MHRIASFIHARSRFPAERLEPGLPMLAFGMVALVYLALNALLGTHLDLAVQAAALGSLLLATPVLARVCLRVRTPAARFAIALSGGAACALVWTLFITIYFASAANDARPGVARIASCAIVSLLLYVPLIWLSCGGARLVSDTSAPTATARATMHKALANAAAWSLACAAIAPQWLAIASLSDWWGPMSMFTGPVGTGICALNAARAGRDAGGAAAWVMAGLACVAVLVALYFTGTLLMMSGWMK
jgi:hypothetical protein